MGLSFLEVDSNLFFIYLINFPHFFMVMEVAKNRGRGFRVGVLKPSEHC